MELASPKIIAQYGEGNNKLIKYQDTLMDLINRYHFNDIGGRLASFNRIIDQERCQQIYQQQVAHYNAHGWFSLFAVNDIVLGTVIGKTKYQVIDGQHRLQVGKMICQNYPQEASKLLVYVAVYHTNSLEELYNYFKCININTVPVPRCYLSADQKDRIIKQVCERVCELLKDTYSGYFFKTTSRRPQRPYINLTLLYEQLNEISCLRDWILKALEENPGCDSHFIATKLFKGIHNYNHYLLQQPVDYFKRQDPPSRRKATERCWKRIHNAVNRLFIGMFRPEKWVYDVINNYL